MEHGPRYRVRRAARNALAACLLALAAPPADGAGIRLAILGDSLTAGYGLAAADAFPVRLEAALRARGLAVTVLDAGVSGDTTAGGLARLDWLLADAPDRAMVALGGNDALRGLEPAETEANLAAIFAKLRAAGVPAMLVGMRAPPNLGAAYERAFNAVFPRLAARLGLPFYPFFLEGVAAAPALNQADGIHPNAAGVSVMVERIAPPVAEWLANAAPALGRGPGSENPPPNS